MKSPPLGCNAGSALGKTGGLLGATAGLAAVVGATGVAGAAGATVATGAVCIVVGASGAADGDGGCCAGGIPNCGAWSACLKALAFAACTLAGGGVSAARAVLATRGLR